MSAGSRLRFASLDREAVDAVAALFGTAVEVEPYTPDGSPVFRLTLGGPADGTSLVLWPSLARVDVNSMGTHGWVLKDVGEVEVIAGVEVVFHPAHSPGHLFVSVNGYVNMVIG